MNRLLALACLLLTACGETDSTTDPLLEAQTRDQVVLINYWAEWCKPCLTEIPELNRFNRERSGVQVVGVNFDGVSGEALEALINKFSIEFPVLATDPAPGLGVPRPGVLPTTLVLNTRGEVVRTLLGPQTFESLDAVTATLSTSE